MDCTLNALFNIWWQDLSQLFVSKGLYTQDETEELDKQHYFESFLSDYTPQEAFDEELSCWND